MDPVKLQAQIVKLQSIVDDNAREKDIVQKEISRLKDQNKRGDTELRKAEGKNLLSDILAKKLPRGKFVFSTFSFSNYSEKQGYERAAGGDRR